jgi:acetyl-CoA C-acetyltransferase
MRDVYILGVGQTRRGWWPARSLGSLAAEAGWAAVEDAGIEMSQIEQGWFGHYNPSASQQTTSGQVVVEALGLSARAGVRNVEHACATGGIALHDARLAVASGVYDIVIALAAAKTHDSQLARNTNETISYDAYSVNRGVMIGHSDFEGYCKEFEIGDREIYAWYEIEYWNAVRNPISLCYRDQRGFLTFEQYCNLPTNYWWSAPIRFGAGSTSVDGASAIVLGTEEWARRGSRPLVKIAGMGFYNESPYYPHSYRHVRFEMMTCPSVGNSFKHALKEARISASDVELYQPHANTPYITAAHLDAFLPMFDPSIPYGYALKWYSSGEAKKGGRLPLNTAGTAKCGYIMAANFLDNNIENVRQLRGDVMDPERQLQFRKGIAMASVSPERTVVSILRREA